MSWRSWRSTRAVPSHVRPAGGQVGVEVQLLVDPQRAVAAHARAVRAQSTVRAATGRPDLRASSSSIATGARGLARSSTPDGASRARSSDGAVKSKVNRETEGMIITRNGVETFKGPADWFTGDVYIDQIATPEASSTFAALSVNFAPGARTAWHTHPHGQTIFVTDGVGRCQREGGPIEILKPGDRVFFEPGENHWHGAAPDRFMVHLAMQQNDESGVPVVWASTSPTSSTPASDQRSGSTQRPSTWIGSPSARIRPPRRRSQMRSQCRADSFLPPVSG